MTYEPDDHEWHECPFCGTRMITAGWDATGRTFGMVGHVGSNGTVHGFCDYSKIPTKQSLPLRFARWLLS